MLIQHDTVHLETTEVKDRVSRYIDDEVRPALEAMLDVYRGKLPDVIRNTKLSADQVVMAASKLLTVQIKNIIESFRQKIFDTITNSNNIDTNQISLYVDNKLDDLLEGALKTHARDSSLLINVLWAAGIQSVGKHQS